MDKGQGWVSMTLNSPMIENGNSPERALTLCLVEDDDSHDVVKTHFGKFFQAFFPEPDECIREPQMDVWPANAPTERPPVLTFSMPVEHDPPEPTVAESPEEKDIRPYRPSTAQPPAEASATSIASTALKMPHCWCPVGTFQKHKSAAEEMQKRLPDTTAKTGQVPGVEEVLIQCSQCHDKFHPFCLPSSARRQDPAWRCARCVASATVGTSAAYTIRHTKEDGVVAMASVLRHQQPYRDEHNKAWSVECQECTRTQSQPPSAPSKLKKGDTFEFCFTLCLDMKAEWTCKGMKESASQQLPCSTCHVTNQDLTMGRSHNRKHHEFLERRCDHFKDESMDCMQQFWTSWQDVPSPLHLLLGFGNYFFTRLEVSVA